MTGLTLYCDGAIDLTALTCSTGWQSVVANPPFDISQIDPTVVITAYMTGFFMFVPIWVVCIGGRAVLRVISTRR